MPGHGEADAVIHVSRLGPTDIERAREMFALVELVFEGEPKPLSDEYIVALLGRRDFWALEAADGARVVGGLIAHTLAMTSAPRSEVFLYDIAVHPASQRRGVGRRLVNELLLLARSEGIETLFVAADDEDAHARDFYRALGGTASPVTMFEFRTE